VLLALLLVTCKPRLVPTALQVIFRRSMVPLLVPRAVLVRPSTLLVPQLAFNAILAIMPTPRAFPAVSLASTVLTRRLSVSVYAKAVLPVTSTTS
jgi:hypothetical protein